LVSLAIDLKNDIIFWHQLGEKMNFIKSRKHMYACSFYLSIIWVFALPSIKCIGSTDSKAIMDILESRLEKLNNLEIKYEESMDVTPPITKGLLNVLSAARSRSNGGNIFITTGTQIHSKEFSYLDGLSLYKKDFLNFTPNLELDNALSNSDTSALSNDISETIAYLNDRIESLSTIRQRNSGKIRNSGTIENKKSLPESTIEFALAMRITGIDEMLSSESLKKMNLTLLNDGNVKLTKIVDNYIIEFIFSQKLGYAPTSHIVYYPNGQIIKQMDMSDFKNVDGLMLPNKIQCRHFFYEEGQQFQTRVENISVRDYALNDPNNVPEKYHIKWPENTDVYDARIGIVFAIVGGRLVNPEIEKTVEEAVNNDVINTSTSTTQSSENTLKEKKTISEIQKIKENDRIEGSQDRSNNKEVLGHTQTNHKSFLIIVCLSGLILLASSFALKHFQNKHTK
jgi:hypothetical protein